MGIFLGYHKKVDANQADLVKYIRSLGASVQHLYAVGGGVPDIIIGYNGKNYLAEVKTLKGKLNPLQVMWFEAWGGQCQVIRTKEDINELLGVRE
tara:strand:- start:279 stop:563 length:285 start_codon:yes stop_codon:yes gene_type:complete